METALEQLLALRDINADVRGTFSPSLSRPSFIAVYGGGNGLRNGLVFLTEAENEYLLQAGCEAELTYPIGEFILSLENYRAN